MIWTNGNPRAKLSPMPTFADAPRRLIRLLVLCGAVVGPAGCSPAPSPDAAESPVAAPPAVSPPAASPLGTLVPPTRGHEELTGTVVERLAAGRYHYLRIREADTERWIATMGAGADVGARVVVRSFGLRRDFDSPRLGRRFDELTFGSVRLADASTPQT